MDNFILTIDGPSGSGKSTICKMLAQNDGFVHIDTGKIYRSIAYLMDENIGQKQLFELKIEFKLKNNQLLLLHNETVLNDLILGEDIAKKASIIAQKDFIRDYVNNLARDIAKKGKFVIDGRDAGSVIFKNAHLKFFLTAKLEARAKRRSSELNVSYEHSLNFIMQRDINDTQRNIAPLIIPQGAIVIDTTNLSIAEAYKEIKRYL